MVERETDGNPPEDLGRKDLSVLSREEIRFLKRFREDAWQKPGKIQSRLFRKVQYTIGFCLTGDKNQKKRYWRLSAATKSPEVLAPVLSILKVPNTTPMRPFEMLKANEWPEWQWYEELGF